MAAIAAECSERYSQFCPGAVWNDTKGVPINAHGCGMLYREGVYYWYGEHKVEGVAGNYAQVGVHCYSSRDLYNWRDEGIVLSVTEKIGHELEKGCVLERPKVIFNEKTGRFVMWFHLEQKGNLYGSARSGVAVSDSPTGVFEFLRTIRPNAGVWPQNVSAEAKVIPSREELEGVSFSNGTSLETVRHNILGRDFQGGQMARDMTLFVDDDRRGYHIYTSEQNSTLHVSLLTDDYLASTGEYVRIFPHRWMEAPALCKRRGKYYLLASGCSGWEPNAARGAVADSIFGPWLEFGNPCVGVNSETGLGGEKTFGGQSTYIQKVHGFDDVYIAMFDIWNSRNAINGRYAWLPMTFNCDRFQIEWKNHWQF